MAKIINLEQYKKDRALLDNCIRAAKLMDDADEAYRQKQSDLLSDLIDRGRYRVEETD